MSELDLLRGLLISSMALGPLGTHRHFAIHASWGSVRWGVVVYVSALVCAVVGLLLPAPKLCAVWLLYCAGTFGMFLRSRRGSLRSRRVLATCVPFLFSNIAAVWFVSGANDLRLLGYGPHFSFYAALHGNVLGWIFLGALAILADREARPSSPYVPAMFTGLVSFLLVAFGIDQFRPLKLFGVIGLSLVLPWSQIAFLRSVWGRNWRSVALGVVSLAGLGVTMALAWGNEIAVHLLDGLWGIPGIVSIHGVLNAVIVAPSFLLAVSLSEPLEGLRVYEGSSGRVPRN